MAVQASSHSMPTRLHVSRTTIGHGRSARKARVNGGHADGRLPDEHRWRHGAVSGSTLASGRAEFSVRLCGAVFRDHRPARCGGNRTHRPFTLERALPAACFPGFGNGSGALAQSGNPVCNCRRHRLTRGRALRDPYANPRTRNASPTRFSRANGGIGERQCGIGLRSKLSC